MTEKNVKSSKYLFSIRVVFAFWKERETFMLKTSCNGRMHIYTVPQHKILNHGEDQHILNQ